MTATAQAPPLKLQGIKTRLVPFIAENARWTGRGRWVEPFTGSGSVPLNLAPERALLSDACPALIDFHVGVQRGRINVATVHLHLQREGGRLALDGDEHYYRVRERFNRSGDPLDFLFLNRACFNGIMRFNGKGEFNTPFCKLPGRFRPALLTRICNQVQWQSERMGGKQWDLGVRDWRETLAQAGPDDFVYADPPYQGRYTGYYGEWNETEAAELADALRSLPCPFMLSTWVENQYRKNELLDQWFPGHTVVTAEHFYHVGAKTQSRYPMIEGLVLSQGENDYGGSEPG